MILGFWISLFIFIFSFLIFVLYNAYSCYVEYIHNVILTIFIGLSIFLVFFFGYCGKIWLTISLKNNIIKKGETNDYYYLIY